MDAAKVIERQLRELAPGANINYKYIGVTPEQIDNWKLPSHFVNKKDSRAKRFQDEFGSEVVELDSLSPDQLRGVVREAIELHMPASRLIEQERLEAEEQTRLRSQIDRISFPDA